MRSNKKIKISISKLRKANDRENCYFIQDCIIDSIMTEEVVKKIGFSRDKNDITIEFELLPSKKADMIWVLCKEYLQVLLEQNKLLEVKIEEKESGILFTYNVTAVTI